MNVKEDMLKKKKEINEKTEIFIFVFLAFILLTTWAMTQPFNSGPDEQMRYYVADYIYKHHGALPGGDDPAVRNKVWGISYAYYPVVSYMVSALFMRISRLFADPGYSMFKIARMADVLFVTGAVYFVVKASGKLFPKEKYSREVRWLFAALAGFMPQAIFMGTYVNTDSLALLAAAMILYAWVSYLREDWTWKNCILLAVGMAVCALAGGSSVTQFCITEISWEGNPVRNVRKNMLRRITDLHCIRRLQSWDGTGKILSFIRIRAGIITGF